MKIKALNFVGLRLLYSICIVVDLEVKYKREVTSSELTSIIKVFFVSFNVILYL